MNSCFKWPSVKARGVPPVPFSENITVRPEHNECCLVHTSASAHTVTFDGSLLDALIAGFVVSIDNGTGAGIVTIAATGGFTMYLASDGTTTSRSLAANGIATFYLSAAKTIKANGTGLT